jgi:hypothetical protein
MAVGKGKSIWWKTGLDNTGLKKGSAEAKGILRTMSQQITGLDVFAGLGAAAVVAFAKISKAAFSMAKDLDLSMREVQTISGYATENFEGMVGAVRSLAKEVPEDAQGLSKALYQIVSAGYDGAEGLKLLEVATKGAVAGVTDTLTAADGLTSVMNAWKISAESATEVSDTFFTTVRLGKTTFGEMAGSIALVAPLAASMGVEFREISSATASLTKQGTPTAVAMTQIRQILISLNEHLGQGWRETYTMQEAMEKLAEIAAASGKDIKEFTGRIEGAVGILGLTGQNAENARKDLEEYNKTLGASEEAYNKMVLAAENQIKIMKSRWHDVLLSWGQTLITMFGNIAKSLNSKATIRAIEEEARAARVAVIDITRLAEGTEERKKAIENLQVIYPNYFDNLDTEKATNEELLTSLRNLNDEYANKIVLQQYADQLDKVSKQEDRLEKRRVRHLEALDYLADRLNWTGLSYDQLIEKMRELAEDDSYKRLRASLGEGVIAGVRKSLNFFDEYGTKLDEITDRKENVTELKDRLLELLGLKKESPVEVDVNVNPVSGQLITSTFGEGEEDAFNKMLDESEQAYEEWNKYKETARANDLKAAYDVYLQQGQTYKEFLISQLKLYSTNADAKLEITKRLAELEYIEIEKAAEKAAEREAQFAERAMEALKANFEKQLAEMRNAYSKSLDIFEKDIDAQLLLEPDTVDELGKAYLEFGEIVFRTDAEVEQLAKDMQEAIDVFGQAGAAMQRFSDSSDYVAQSIGKMTEGLAYLASGNYLGAIMTFADAVAGFFDGIAKTKKEANAKAEADHVDRLNRHIESLNRSLEKHLYLLGQLEGKGYLDQAAKTVAEYNRKLNDLSQTIEDFTLKSNAAKDPFKKPDQNDPSQFLPVPDHFWKNMDFDEMYDWLDENYDMLNKASADQLKQFLDDYETALRERDALIKEIKFETVGFDASFITDEIVSAFENAEDAAIDFSQSFEDIMRKAMINVWKQNFLQEQVAGFYEQLYTAMSTSGATRRGGVPEFGGLSDRELDNLQSSWDEIVANAEQGWSALEQFFESALDDFEYPTKEGLEGAIKGVTEDTAQILAGQITAIRFNILENQEIAQDSLDALNQIQINTSNNVYLPMIRQELRQIRQRLGGR